MEKEDCPRKGPKILIAYDIPDNPTARRKFYRHLNKLVKYVRVNQSAILVYSVEDANIVAGLVSEAGGKYYAGYISDTL